MAGKTTNANIPMKSRNHAQPTQSQQDGGQGGIRTLGDIAATHAFQACSFDHSDTCPWSAEARNWVGAWQSLFAFFKHLVEHLGNEGSKRGTSTRRKQAVSEGLWWSRKLTVYLKIRVESPSNRKFIPHPSSLIPHPSSLIPHPSSHRLRWLPESG